MSRFAVLSDTGPGTAGRLMRMLAPHEPVALLFAGDHHPTRFGVTYRSAWEWRRSVGAPLRDAVMAVPGNHDHHPRSGLDGWMREFRTRWPVAVPREGGVSWFLADLGDLRVIGLDTGPHADRVSDQQMRWLEDLTLARAVPPVIAMGHAPLAGVSLHMGRALDRDPARRDRLVNALQRIGVRLYICGHEHLYAHRLIEGRRGAPIHQITLGGGGATSYEAMTPDVVRSVATPHAGLLVVDDDVVLRVLDVDGRPVDVVTVPRPEVVSHGLAGYRR